jgi:sugar phosphate isomerase/epimerase
MAMINRLGCYSRYGYDLPLKIRLELIKKAGFSSASILYSEEEELVKNGEEKLIPDLVKKTGLFLENVHAPFMDYNLIWSKEREDRAIISKVINSCASFCGLHKIPIVIMHISKGDDVPGPNVHGLNEIKNMVDYAENSNVIIALENTRKNTHLEYLLSKIDSPGLGFCYDSGHDFLYSTKPGEILKKFGHLLVATHFHDNDGISDRHWLPKKGSMNWDVVERNFPKESYKGPISLEAFPKSPESQSPESFLKEAFLTLSSLDLL